MAYIEFDKKREYDLVLLGRATIDFNPMDYYKTLGESQTYKKYLGGSPANIAVGLSRLGKKCGFIGRTSDDQFGDFIIDAFKAENVDVSRMKRCINGEKTGLTFTEILSKEFSRILMYRNEIADLSLSVEDIDEEYIKNAKALLISGTALSKSPSREAAIKAMTLAKRTDTPIIFDIDYREYSWEGRDDLAIYYSMAARDAAVILGSREEYDLTEALIRPGMNDEETAAYWLSQRAQIVIIKHGKEGSTAYTKNGASFTIRPFPVEMIKGFGGGDGYASAFLYGLFEGMEIIDCLELGSGSASMLVASHGCSADMPNVKELNKFIADSKKEHGEMIARG